MKKLEELEACLQPGFLILNWNSLGIPEFIAACSKSINAFQQLVKQVKCGAVGWSGHGLGLDVGWCGHLLQQPVKRAWCLLGVDHGQGAEGQCF